MLKVKEGQYVTCEGYKEIYKVSMVLSTGNEPVYILSVDYVGNISYANKPHWVSYEHCKLYANTQDDYITKLNMLEYLEQNLKVPVENLALTGVMLGNVVQRASDTNSAFYVVEDIRICDAAVKVSVIDSAKLGPIIECFLDNNLFKKAFNTLEEYRESLKTTPDPIADYKGTRKDILEASNTFLGIERENANKSIVIEEHPEGRTCFTVDALEILPEYQIKQSIKPTQEVNIMNTSTQGMSACNTAVRTVVSVVLLDPSKGIEDVDSIVKDCGQHVMSGSQQELIQEILMDPKLSISDAIVAHNKDRALITDLDILSRTGNKVALQPIKISQLLWSIK